MLLSDRLIQDPAFQTYILDKIGEKIGFDIAAEEITVNWLYGVGIRAHVVEAVSRSGRIRMEAADVRIVLSATGLLQREIAPTRIDVYRPVVHLRSIASESAGPAIGWAGGIFPVLLRQFGELVSLRLEDGQLDLNRGSFRLKDFDLLAEQRATAPLTVDFKTRGRVIHDRRESVLSLEGEVKEDAAHPGAPICQMRLEGRSFPIWWLPWPSFIPWGGGRMDADISLKGSLIQGFTGDVRLKGRQCAFEIRKGQRSKAYRFSELALITKAAYADRRIELPSFVLQGPGFDFTGSSGFDLNDADDPDIRIVAKSGPIRLEDFMPLIPDSILPAWLEKDLFPLLRDGEAVLNGIRVAGPVSRIGSLNERRNADTLSLSIGWKGLTADTPWAPVPFRSIPGSLEISDEGLRILGVGAFFGQSELQAGSMTISDLYERHPVFDFGLKGRFDVSDLVAIARRVPLPPGLKQWATRVKPESVSGSVAADVRAVYVSGSEWPVLQSGVLEVIDARWTPDDSTATLHLEQGTLELDLARESRFSTRFDWEGSSFEVDGAFGPGWESGWALSGQGGLDLLRLLHHTGAVPSWLPEFPGRVPCRFSLVALDKGWGISGEWDISGVGWNAPFFSIELPDQGCRVTFEGTYLPDENMRVAGKAVFFLEDSTAEVTGFGDADLLRLKISSPSLSLKGLRFRPVPSERAPLEGVLKGDLKVVIPRRSPKNFSAEGILSGKGMAWTLPITAMSIRDGAFALALDGESGEVEELSFLLDGGRVSGYGTLDSLRGTPRGDGHLEVERVDLSRILESFKKSDAWKSARKDWDFPRKADFGLSMTIDQAEWKGRACGRLKGRVVLADGALALEEVELQMQQTRLSLTGSVRRGQSPSVQLSTHVRSEGQPISGITQLCGWKPTEIEGHLSMEGVFFSHGGHLSDFKQNLDGRAAVRLEDGIVRRSNLIIKILEFLSLQRIVDRRPDDIAREGFYFQSIEGQVAAEKGVLKSDDLLIRSPAFNAAVEGTLDLFTRTVAMDMGVQPLGTIDSLVSRIPVVGYILGGEDKTVLVYRFNIHGPLERPEIDYVPLKNLGGSVKGYLERLIGTPWRLLKEIGRISKEIEQTEPLEPAEEGL